MNNEQLAQIFERRKENLDWHSCLDDIQYILTSINPHQGTLTEMESKLTLIIQYCNCILEMIHGEEDVTD